MTPYESKEKPEGMDQSSPNSPLGNCDNQRRVDARDQSSSCTDIANFNSSVATFMKIDVDNVIKDISQKIEANKSNGNNNNSSRQSYDAGGNSTGFAFHANANNPGNLFAAQSHNGALGGIDERVENIYHGVSSSAFIGSESNITKKGPNCLSMREWMAQVQAKLSHDIQNSLSTASETPLTSNPSNRPVVSSKSYLAAALKIGQSLAAQLVHMENIEATNINSHANALDSNYLNWAEQVVVEISSAQGLKTEESTDMTTNTQSSISDIFSKKSTSQEEMNEASNRSGGEDIGAGCIPNIDLGADELAHLPGSHNVLDFSIDDLFEDDAAGAGRGCSKSIDASCDQNNILLDVLGARITQITCNRISLQRLKNENQLKQGGVERKNEIQNNEIHALGVVFFELFSGGVRPPDLRPSSTGGRDGANHSFHNPLPVEKTKGIDLSSALTLLDENDFLENNDCSLRHDPLTLGTGSPLDIPCASDIVDGLDFDDMGTESKEDHSNRSKRVFRDPSLNKSAECCDSLKSMHIPTVICDLIANMLDAKNGDFSGENAYKSTSDIINDMEWMMSNLDQIIRNSDPNELLMKGLKFSNQLYGRKAEVKKLMEAYEKSLSGVAMATISGPSGVGKSRLAQEIALISSQKGGGALFLTGKFDQLQQAKPFSAIASALNIYCDSVLENGTPESIKAISSKFRSHLGNDGIGVLSKLIPSLKNFFDPSGLTMARLDSCVDAQKRVQYFLGNFVEVISSLTLSTFILFLDDVQWADSSSIQFIHQFLLRVHYSRKKLSFFLLASFRDGEYISDVSIHSWMDDIQSSGLDITRIRLKGIDKECTNTMISDLLCLPPRLTRPLSDVVHHKTQGNQLFVIQLLKALHKDGILYLSLGKRQWEWDMEKVNATSISDDVAMVLTSTINALPLSVREAMCIASCFGAYLEKWIIQTLEERLGVSLFDPLEIAVKEGLMDKRGDQWHFAHDRVQEAAYNMMKPEERCLHHLKYGLEVSSVAINEDNDNMFLTAVDQINRGGPKAVSDKSQNAILAKLNLNAGYKAADRSDFATAFSFYDHGISYLRRGHWKQNYGLSLDLHVGAVNGALALGDFSTLSILTDQVMTNATCFEDKLAVMYANLRALEAVSKFPEAVEKGMSVLDQLGVKLSEETTSWETSGLLTKTKNMLLGFNDHNLLNLKKMGDLSKIMAMKFLARMQFLLIMTNPAAQPGATLLMVQLSLSYGISSLTPSAFVFYGSLLGVLGEVREGYRYIKLALKLFESFDATLSREAASEAYAMGSQVMAYVEPLQSLDDLILRGHKFGLESGDTNSAMLCLLLSNACCYWGGKNLQMTKSSMENSLNLMKQYSNITWMSNMLPLYRSTLCMIGEAEGIQTLLGKCVVSEETQREKELIPKNPHLGKLVYFNRMYVAFTFRRFSEMKRIAEKYFEFFPKLYFMLLSHAANTFYEGLVSFWIAREEANPCENIWFKRGKLAMSAMKRWSEECSFNYQHKLLLLEAEKCYCMKDVKKARHLYEFSISSATKHKFIHEEALACELAGYFSIETGQHQSANSYLSRAQERYQTWGAYAKANLLSQFIHDWDYLNTPR